MPSITLPRAAVRVKSPYLYRKIELELLGVAVCSSSELEADIYIVESALSDTVKGRCITLGEGGDIPLPFRLGELRALIVDKKNEKFSLDRDSRSVTLHGKRVRLTEVEYSLLAAMMSRRGAFAKREELLREVWGEGTDSGVVNVYIHYLREKLEREGEKIIISSRREGYKIDGRFFGEEEEDA